MKKILFTVAALGLAVGLTATAASAASFSAKGKVSVVGIYTSQGATDATNGLTVAVNGVGNAEANDAVHQSFYLYPTINVNDNIDVKAQLRFIDRQIMGDGHTAASEDMRVFHLWMDYKSPVGKWSIGRQLGGTWGTAFMNSTGNADRIIWTTNFMPEPWSLKLLWQKTSEMDAYTSASDEMDNAGWYAGLGHKGDMGKTDLAVWHVRQDNDRTAPAGDTQQTQLRFATDWNFGAINLTSEVNYDFGDDPARANTDISSLNAMANISTQMDALTAGILTFYMQGDMDRMGAGADGDNNGFGTRTGIGNDYNPFLIATGDYFGLLNGDKGGYHSAVVASAAAAGAPIAFTGDGQDNPGAIALAAYGVYKLNDKMTLNGAIGHIWADEVPAGVDDAMGMEIDLGMTYKLLDNLSYSAQAGYLAVGDMLDDIIGNTDDVFVLLHSLTMTF